MLDEIVDNPNRDEMFIELLTGKYDLLNSNQREVVRHAGLSDTIGKFTVERG